jgi:polar amino acid transport system substrate-binding protein
MLQADRASAIAEQGAVIDSLILSGGFTNIKKLPIPLASKDYYLMLSKQFVGENPQLALDFWQAIADVRDSVFAEVVHQYMPEN